MAYDVKTDYMKLMEQSASEGNINKAAEYERQRNAKIKGEELPYDLTYRYNPQVDNISAISSLANTRSQGGVGNPYAQQLTPATSQANYIKDMYAAQQAQTRTQLENAYRRSLGELDIAETKIAPAYNQARNQTAATSEVNRNAFNEYAAASGLGSGSGGQAQLAMSNTLLGNLSSLDRGEADAIGNIADQRANMAREYQSAISNAIANNNTALASALYEEAVRVDNSLVATSQAQAAENRNAFAMQYGMQQDAQNQTLAQEDRQRALAEQQRSQIEAQAKNLAAYGNFDGYRQLGYTDSQIAQMKAIWAVANPELAAAISAPATPTVKAPVSDESPSMPPYQAPIVEQTREGTNYSAVLNYAQTQRAMGTPVENIANFIVSRIGDGITENEAIQIGLEIGLPI